MRRRKREVEQARRLLALGRSVPRQVGICGSCGGPVMLNPDEAHATCGCGVCRLPRALLRYGEAS